MNSASASPHRRAISLSLSMLALASGPALAAGYRATLLPPLAGLHSVVRALDAAGAAYGESSTGGSGPLHATRWQGGMATDLAFEAGVVGQSRSHDGNPAGQVVVGSWPNGSFVEQLSDNGLLAPLPGYGCCSAWLNSAGAVAYTNTLGEAVVYDGAGVVSLGKFGGDSASPMGISDAGHVVGYRYLAGADLRAFVWKDGVATLIEPLAGGAPGNSTIALDANEAGQVLVMTSIAADPNAWHVAIWKDGAMQDTGIWAQESTIPAGGYVINNAGQVLTANGVWKDGQFHSLAEILPPEAAIGMHADGSYWIFNTLVDMNDAGQIVGRAIRYDLSTMASSNVSFILDPDTLCGQ